MEFASSCDLIFFDHGECYVRFRHGAAPGKFEGYLADLHTPENVAKLKPKLAQQASDATRNKAWEFQNNKSMGEYAKLQENCRGMAKDISTKLDPNLAASNATTPAEQEALRRTRAHWRQVQEVMNDFGNNRIGPITAQQKLYQITGKNNIHQIIDDMGETMKRAVQWGR